MIPQLPMPNPYLYGGNNFGFTAFTTIDPNQSWGFVLFTNSEYGEQLGGALAFYLLTGPNTTLRGVLVAIFLLIFFFVFLFSLKCIVSKLRTN